MVAQILPDGPVAARHNNMLGFYMSINTPMTAETKGMLLGLLGVAAFSLTLPATRAAVESLNPFFVGIGRAVVASLLAAIYLAAGRHRLPTKNELKSLVVVALGVVVGFPILSALAMRTVDASHGGVMLGVLPLATAAAGFVFSRERPSRGFWVMAILGSTLVVAFSLLKGHGSLRLADAALLAAVVCAAIGYAVGARLTQSLGGLQVISWALVISAPFLIAPALFYAPNTVHLSTSVWLGFIYVSLVSQFLGFLPWYRGLALGGIARVGQTQLLQPFFTMAAASLLLREVVDEVTVVFAVIVVGVVAIGRRLNIAQKS
jgi:drug/metabolite transporter (DMT)-like permease